ncbi:hypothetical protein AB0F17_14750 [Nonomuraea sp. NPDC026600]|uniref:hypothetical protein n=1 Tax=Nonomuraea sp. NPDC026600 TaxID=3155363 RepID=UPI0033DC934F
MAELWPFHGPHPALPLAVHEHLTWYPPANRTHRVRVTQHSCECRSTLFELCHAAGQAFIRRTIRGNGNPVVHETDWLLTATADCLFQRILLGQAR